MEDPRPGQVHRALADLCPPGTGVAVCRLDADAHGSGGDGESGFPRIPIALGQATVARKREFLAGRACARQALLLAGAPVGHEIGIGSLRAPQWPDGYTGSISHSAGLAAAVAAPHPVATGLGLDLEPVVAPAQAQELSRQIGRTDEWVLLDPGGHDAAAAFTLLFSAKEALFKCLAPQVGRYFDFLDVEATALQGRVLTLALRIPLATGLPAGATFPVGFARLDRMLVCVTAQLPERA